MASRINPTVKLDFRNMERLEMMHNFECQPECRMHRQSAQHANSHFKLADCMFECETPGNVISKKILSKIWNMLIISDYSLTEFCSPSFRLLCNFQLNFVIFRRIFWLHYLFQYISSSIISQPLSRMRAWDATLFPSRWLNQSACIERCLSDHRIFTGNWLKIHSLKCVRVYDLNMR